MAREERKKERKKEREGKGGTKEEKRRVYCSVP
jgi:hypothetical protein